MSESRSSIVFVTEPLIGCLTHLVKSSESYSSDSSGTGLDLDELEVSYDYNDSLHKACQIDLDYAAPEFVLNNDICQANDMFALGCLAYAVHNKGVSILKTFNSEHSYQKQVESINKNPFKNMPAHLRPVLTLLFSLDPNRRMTAKEFQNSKYFDNILVSTIRFLEGFPEKTKEEKAQFMKGLSKILPQFPERIIKRKILPSLLEELKNSQLLPYTIPNIMNICLNLDQHEFSETVLPHLKPAFLVRDPPQNMIVLLEKLDILQSKTSRETFRDDVMPLVYASLESPTAIVQEKSLRIIPSLAQSLDYTTVKSSLFPRIQVVFSQTTALSVKVSTLICFHSMVKVLDKFTIQEKLVPGLKNIKTKEPAVMLATLAVYDEIGKTADKEIIATEILPQLWKMSFGPLLNLEQFQKFMKTIRELTDRVEESHIRHLKEAKSLEEQTSSISMSSKANNDTTDNIDFESLVQGNSLLKSTSESRPMNTAADSTSQSATLSSWSSSILNLSDSNHQSTTKSSWDINHIDLINPKTSNTSTKAGTFGSHSSVMTPTDTLNSQSSLNNTWNTSINMGHNNANHFANWSSGNGLSAPKSNQSALKNNTSPMTTIHQTPASNGINYSSLGSFSGNSSSIPVLKPPTMNTVQSTLPYSKTSSTTTNNVPKKFDFHAFDPLA
ncbi:hypothetical protein BY458DRAFT_533549 [Sporodiniella umbellata]|nr:hypothetical protein BY458DRAFT_533549 [Sporodiniella umbellata]